MDALSALYMQGLRVYGFLFSVVLLSTITFMLVIVCMVICIRLKFHRAITAVSLFSAYSNK